MAIASIHHREEDNVSRQTHFKDDADRIRLTVKMAQRPEGWIPSLGIPNVYQPSDKAILKKYQDETVKGLGSLLTALEADSNGDATYTLDDGIKVTVTKEARILAFRKMYMDAKGKFIVPEYFGVNCFRRFNVLLEANAIRLRRKDALILEIPVLFTKYGSDAERFEACVLENTLKMAGALKPSYQDMLLSTIKLLQCGSNQSTIRRLHGAGLGQKLFALAELNRLYPKTKVAERVANGEIEFGPLGKEEIRKLMDTANASAWKISAPEKDVESFLLNPKAAEGNKPKMAKREELEGVATRSPIKLIQFTMDCALKNNLGALAKFGEPAVAEKLNAAIDKVLKEYKIEL